MYKILGLLFCCACAGSIPTYAQTNDDQDVPPANAVAPQKRLQETLTKTEQKLSGGINSLSSSLDSFFSSDDSEAESYDSRVKLGYSAGYTEYKDPAYNLILGAKLILPKTKKRLQLILISDEDDLYERKETGESTPDATPNDSVQNQKVRIGLRNVFHKTQSLGIVLDMGVKIKDPPDPFLRFAARKSLYFGAYEFRAIERLYWFESEGWGTSLSFDLDRPIEKNWLFRFSNNGVLDHETGLWSLDHFFALYHRYSDRSAFGYFTGVTGNDEPNLASQSVYLAFNYRYLLFSDWLYFQATPKLAWVREYNFRDVPGILLKIEANLGGI